MRGPLLLLLAGLLAGAEFATVFAPGEAGWTPRIDHPGTLAPPAAGGQPGLVWRSDALAVLAREIDVGDQPFELAVDLRMTAGRRADWRCAGLGISLGTAPPDAAGPDDWCVLFAVREQGVLATAVGGRPVWGVEVRPGVWNVQSRNLAKRFQLSMAGAGGSDYSIDWPNAWVAGTRIRGHVWRDAAHVLRFTLFHADGAPAPWWEGAFELPAALRGKPLRHLAIFTTNEVEAYKPGAQPLKPLLGGVVEGLRVRSLAAGGPTLAEPFPEPPLPSFAAQRTPSIWYGPGGLAALRQRFASPAFAAWRTILLRNAEQAPATVKGSPADAEPIVSLLWAHLLTGDEAWWTRLLPLLDAASGPTDLLPHEQWGSPGVPRQRLSVMEFEVHRYAALAMVYDTCFERLDATRRANVLRALRRAVAHYERQIQANDWWYRNNPSNTIGVGNGASAIAALALRHEEPERAKAVAALAAKTIHANFRGVAPDGGCLEGNMYWNYGLHFPLLLGHALRNLGGDDQGLLRTKQLENAHRYAENILGGDGRMITFNDTQPWLNGWVVVSAAAGGFDRPGMRWLADHMAAEFATGGTAPEQDRGLYAVASFLLRGETAAPPQMPPLPTLSVLASINEGVMRSDGTLRPRLLTGVKGNGKENTHHANQDQGGFVLHANGEVALLDPGYFDGGADRHSLPLFAGREALDAKAEAPISDAWEAGAVRSMAVDASAAHNAKPAKGTATPPPVQVRRVFVQVGGEALIVLDDLVPALPGDRVMTRFQAGLPATVDGMRALLTGANGTVAIACDGPALQLVAKPMKFAKEWVYFRTGVTWTCLEGAYAPDPAQPLITVFTPAATGATPATATVQRSEGRITVQVGRTHVGFARDGGRWRTIRPD